MLLEWSWGSYAVRTPPHLARGGPSRANTFSLGREQKALACSPLGCEALALVLSHSGVGTHSRGRQIWDPLSCPGSFTVLGSKARQPQCCRNTNTSSADIENPPPDFLPSLPVFYGIFPLCCRTVALLCCCFRKVCQASSFAHVGCVCFILETQEIPRGMSQHSSFQGNHCRGPQGWVFKMWTCVFHFWVIVLDVVPGGGSALHLQGLLLGTSLLCSPFSLSGSLYFLHCLIFHSLGCFPALL